ncbi:hypothetical protein BsWGS_27772 [Bradybaena similaris]
MATCGSFSLWLAIGVLATLSSIGKCQANGGSQQTPSPDNCTAFIANSSCPFSGLEQKSYCLENGTQIIGFCAAREAVCGNNMKLHKDFTACSSNTKDTPSSSTSKTTTGKTTGFPFNTRDRTESHHDHTGEHKDHDHNDDNAAPFSKTPGHAIVLCGFIAAAYASRLFLLL